MKALYVRLDSRLVHGQVCTAWTPQLGINRIVIVHDLFGGDPFMAKVYRMAVPAGVQCDALKSDAALEEWQKNQFGDGNVLVLFPDVKTAKKLYDAGFHFDHLQVGTLPGGRNKVTISKQVNVSAENVEDFKYLLDQGIHVFCQMVPSDSRVPIGNLLSKFK